jgi:hypothetical protein
MFRSGFTEGEIYTEPNCPLCDRNSIATKYQNQRSQVLYYPDTTIPFNSN